MYSVSNQTTAGGVSVATILTLIFVVLKLTDNIDWSWWWVLSPLWISIGLTTIAVILLTVVYIIKNK
jgi:membrane protein YdbS with pleckstrin-like domain